MKIVCVTGSREYRDQTRLFQVLDTHHPQLIVHGGARGADTLAELYGTHHRIPTKVFRADWDTYGKSAGHLRNIEMGNALIIARKKGHQITVVAFPIGESRGTRHMMKIARARNFDLHVIDDDTIDWTPKCLPLTSEGGHQWT